MRIWMTALLTALLVFCTTGVAQPEQLAVPDGYGVLTGKLLRGGKPLPLASIAVFKADSGSAPDRGSSRRIPEGMFRAEGGRFRIDLPPGRYHLGVVARLDPDRKGPPGPDEGFFFVRDKKGELRQIEVRAGKTINLGVLSGKAPENFPEIANAFTVKGAVYDEQGKPFGGVLVLVRQEPNVPRPLFISPPTGKDGKYQLKLPAGQSYYLVVRKSLTDVGRPAVGSLVGAYVKDPAPAATRSPIMSGGDPVTGGVGQVLTGMDIIMRRVPDPDEIKDEVQNQAQFPMPSPGAGDMPPPAPGAP